MRPHARLVLAGLLLSLVGCGIKGAPRPPEPPPPPTPETQPPMDAPRGPLEPSAPPTDGGTP
jgi:hypothetical protein